MDADDLVHRGMARLSKSERLRAEVAAESPCMDYWEAQAA